jgi:hypothetical protein
MTLKHKRDAQKSKLAPAAVHEQVDNGTSNVIPMYCFHYGDLEVKPPVLPKVCHKIDPITFCCTAFADPVTKCRFTGYNEDIPQYSLGCPFAPYEEFERFRKAWAEKGRKVNPLKASRRASKRAAK